MINDTDCELPSHEVSYPADHDEKKVAVPLLEEMTSQFQFIVYHVVGDANYDTESILKYIVSEMKAQPVIPLNPRRRQKDPFQVKKDIVLCPANLEMHRKGRMKNQNRIYLQYSCPLYWGKNTNGSIFSVPSAIPSSSNKRDAIILFGCRLVSGMPSIMDLSI